mgnify:CR=1 FL=1
MKSAPAIIATHLEEGGSVETVSARVLSMTEGIVACAALIPRLGKLIVFSNNGSLYVGSPPGIWKLTDTDNDGVADLREMIVGGFDYTGNAADIHGPFLHPNGRLYWCHGRKGHKVAQKNGTLVDESLACGIWSCKPDGSDVAWHSLGCGDNPVEVDFTRDGDIIGVQQTFLVECLQKKRKIDFTISGPKHMGKNFFSDALTQFTFY